MKAPTLPSCCAKSDYTTSLSPCSLHVLAPAGHLFLWVCQFVLQPLKPPPHPCTWGGTRRRSVAPLLHHPQLLVSMLHMVCSMLLLLLHPDSSEPDLSLCQPTTWSLLPPPFLHALGPLAPVRVRAPVRLQPPEPPPHPCLRGRVLPAPPPIAQHDPLLSLCSNCFTCSLSVRHARRDSWPYTLSGL